ncbi:MAG TPA: DNA polymerase III subunit epsilon [Steroidobacteraceae bacterium]|nr:DNA polymerase III subunit epsilon [Steroidobacteraceae bacterium]
MRQIVFDTETTGLEPELGHRIIEIGAIEIVNRRRTGRQFHRYLCPEREIDPGALQVHGLTSEFLGGQPRFAEIYEELREFIAGAELIIHNAPFDVAFLDAEMARLAEKVGKICTRDVCGVLDTLVLARQMHPGQRNGLDALCKRYSIDNSHRDLHGALLDADLLLEVYLAMTGGQGALTLDDHVATGQAMASSTRAIRPAGTLVVLRASDEERAAHEGLLKLLDKASGGRTAWRSFEPVSSVPAAEQPAIATSA